MSIVRDSIPSVSITSCACSRLSGLEVLYGIRTPTTLSAPSASTARNAVSDESTPPEIPTIPFVNPRRRTTSSLRKLTSQRGTRDGGRVGSISRGIELHSSALTRPPSPLPRPQVFDQMRQIHLEVREQRSLGPRPRQLGEIEVVRQDRLF